MGKKKKNNNPVQNEVVTEEVVTEEVVTEEVVTEEVVQITSTEIKIISNIDLNFKNFKVKKGEELIISDSVFDALCQELPNLELFRQKGIIQIVK